MIRAAQMQHVLAIQVRRHAAKRDEAGESQWSLPAVAERTETMNYDALMRVLRGDVHMTLLHVIDLSRTIGKDLLRLAADPRGRS